MYANKKGIDRRIDIRTALQFVGALNVDKTIYLAQMRQSKSAHKLEAKQKIIVKSVSLFSDSQQGQMGQEAVLKKLMASPVYYIKPNCYDFKDNCMYICSKIEPLSLQSILWIHQKEQKTFRKSTLQHFAVRMFESIAKLKSTDLFHKNLKPSNIFLEVNQEGENVWGWSEAGMHTNYRSKYYCKAMLQNTSKNTSIKFQPVEIEFYSLGLILIEMVTLQPIEDVDRAIKKTGNIATIKNIREAQQFYGVQLINVVRLLVDLPKDNSLAKAISEYKNARQDDEEAEDFDYRPYYLKGERIAEFFQKELIPGIEARLKSYLADKEVSARGVFDIMQQYDPDLNFHFSGMDSMEKFLRQFNIKFSSEDELLFACLYYTSGNCIRYFKLLQKVIPPKDILECIIAKSVENYNNFKDFFETQTNGAEYWKAEQIRQFLDNIEVVYTDKEISEVVRQWTNSSRSSVKYDQIYKIFKPILGMSMTLSSIKAPKAEQSDDHPLLDIMKQLMSKEPNLISFFRKHDTKENWIVDYKIEKTIRNYVKAGEEGFKRAFVEMWEKGSIPGDMTKQLNYVYLIRNMEIYSNIELLRMVITEKINETNREAFFEKYKKTERGWTVHSLKDFNQDENIDFDDREINQLFAEMDSNHSGDIDMSELTYQLTGLKEFDLELIVGEVKAAMGRSSISLFDEFFVRDQKAKLLLQKVDDLQKVLESIGMQLSEDHLEKLYSKFARSNKFQYLVFLRFFYDLDKIFLTATKFVIREYYNNDFDKFFSLGLRDGRKKWIKKSLNFINDELVLGFKETEIGDVWEKWDPNHESSLTKQEVGEIFRYDVEETEELTRKQLDHINDHKEAQGKGEPSKEALRSSKTNRVNTGGSQRDHEGDGSTFLKEMKGKDLMVLLVQCYRQSEAHSGRIQLDVCLDVLTSLKLKSNKTDIMKVLSTYKQTDKQKKTCINYLNLVFFLCECQFGEDDGPKWRLKSQMVVFLLKEIKKGKGMSNEDIFKICRRSDKMRLSDFEEVIRQLLDVEVYFHDLEEVWNYWGEREYINQTDFDQIIHETIQGKGNDRRDGSADKHGQKNEKIMRQPSAQIKKKSNDNKMRNFMNESQGSDTPYLKQEFPQKTPQYSRKQQKRESNIGQTFGKESNKDSKRNSRDERQRQTGKYVKEFEGSKEVVKEKPYLHVGNTNENRISLEEKVELKKERSTRKEQDQEEPNAVQHKPSYGRTDLLDKLSLSIQSKGDQHLNDLFRKVNIIQNQRFISCMTFNYDFNEHQAQELCELISTFGKVKLENIKKHLSSHQKEQKEMKEQKEQTSKGKREENTSKGKREEQTSKGKRLSQQNQGASTSKQKTRSKMMDRQPNKKQQKERSRRLSDPRKQKLNAPLIKQHIKMLISSFCKRFQVVELQPFFFQQSDVVLRAQFVKKCQQINGSISASIYDKMFEYLRPSSKDEISVLSFKLSFNFESKVVVEEDYFPEELEKELRLIFDKADKDKSGFIEPNEVEELLSSLGFNESIKEIQNYFMRLDTNFDNKVSFKEFKQFIEDHIIPQLNNFDEEVDEFERLLRNNDIFRHGSLSAVAIQSILDRFSVKVNEHEVLMLSKHLSIDGDEINIKDLIAAVKEPNSPNYPPQLKAVLYKIRLRKKVYLKDIQKIFENISSSFVLAYTAAAIKKQLLTHSACFEPVLHESGLIYQDYCYRDVRKVTANCAEAVLVSEVRPADLLVELFLKEACGIPIPQKNDIKGSILRRGVNVTLFDLSAQTIKHCICSLQAEWDRDVEDVWSFNKNNRSVYLKMANFEPRKYEKYVLLLEFVITLQDGTRTLDVSCGSTNIPLKELFIVDSKLTRKLKIIAGLPNKSKEIDKTSVSKRTNWKSFFGSADVESELELEIIPGSKFKEAHAMLGALPTICLFNKKALHYLWTFREYFGERSWEGTRINPHFGCDLKVRTFLLTLDVPDLSERVVLFWREKIEQRVKTIRQAKLVLQVLLQQLHLVVHTRQFDLLPSMPSATTLHNKSLGSLRAKMVGEVLENVEQWLKGGIEASYKRKKNYGYSYYPYEVSERELNKEHRTFIENICKLTLK